jgi:hypothetical protein
MKRLRLTIDLDEFGGPIWSSLVAEIEEEKRPRRKPVYMRRRDQTRRRKHSKIYPLHPESR